MKGRCGSDPLAALLVKPTLVTGASGFVGWHVARLLSARGHRVRALVRPCQPAARTGCRSRSPATCAIPLPWRAPSPAAAWSSTSPPTTGSGRKDPDELYHSNVDGTRNLLEAARKAGVERVVYTSTVGCIGVPHGCEGDEDQPVTLQDMSGTYKRSKFLAEKAALEFAASGFPVIAVNPTAPIGDHDFKPTPTGKIILDFLKGAMPAFIDTGLNLVDVKDVAEGNLLACERGRPGERYILGCENVTPGSNPAKAGEDHRPARPDHQAAVFRGLRGRGGEHGLGQDHGKTAHGAARCRAHGKKENVGVDR